MSFDESDVEPGQPVGGDGHVLPAAAASTAPRLSFEEVFKCYRPYVVRRLRRLRVPQADADDVAQEVLKAVSAGLANLDDPSKIKAWISTICLRKASNYLRSSCRRERPTESLPGRSLAPDQEEQLTYHERIARLKLALANVLSEKQREVFMLYAVEGVPMVTVARIAGCPVFTAYMRLRTARHRIRVFFESS
jgi:RNA polymerase sigma factor (sigma-70 family)